MNCQEFSEYAMEIARAQVLDARARDAALGHTEECDDCSARLESERALTAALRATTESFNHATAPARVEAALLAAFRAERDAARETVNVQPLTPAAPRVRTLASPFGRRVRVAFAASAVAASLIFAFVLVRRMPQQPESHLAVNEPRAIPSQSPVVPTDTNATSLSQSEPVMDTSAGDETKGRLNRDGESGRPARMQRAAGGQSMKKTVTEMAYAFDIDGGQAVFTEGESPTGASEIAGLRDDEAALTDFVPISAGTTSAPLDSGQVVRIEAPRAALASLGLPVDARRANEKLKADLLLGHDGTAHAIRLVR